LVRFSNYSNKIFIFRILGNYKQAIDYINRALSIIKKEFGDKHYKYGMFLNSLGLAYAMTNDYKMAYIHLKQALQILINSLGPNHIEVCDVYSNLGEVCMKFVIENDQPKDQYQNEKQSKLEEAKRNFLEAQRIVQATFGNEHTKAIQFKSLLFIIDNYNSLCKI
jgi:tetratricopeptide (TPR) repeat protein